MMREIVLDTETTGLNPRGGDRLVEIGALELMHHLPTGRQLHLYINPERDVPQEAVNVHGLTTAFLADKPLFADIVDEFLAFIGDDPLVIHNASFDMGFINAELARLGRSSLPDAQAIDTLLMARRKFPGAQANLDALCRRFEIDNTHRDLHGALVDADLLAHVYIELLGGRQPGLSLDVEPVAPADNTGPENALVNFTVESKPVRPIRAHAPSADELAAHAAFLQRLKDPVWTRD
jgi:DNA polymerase-3 subunit epsilon